MNKRSNKKINSDREKIRVIILAEFIDKTFTLSEVYYKFHTNKDSSIMCSMFNDFKSLVNEGFLRYSVINKKTALYNIHN